MSVFDGKKRDGTDHYPGAKHPNWPWDGSYPPSKELTQEQLTDKWNRDTHILPYHYPSHPMKPGEYELPWW